MGQRHLRYHEVHIPPLESPPPGGRHGDNRVGAVADLIGALAAAQVNITALDAVSVHHRYGALFWVAPKDLKKAAKALSALNAPADAMTAALATLGP